MIVNPPDRDPLEMTRREALTAGLGLLAVAALGLPNTAAAAPATSPGGGPFKLALQSYSLRGYKKAGKADADKALALTKELGLAYWEAYPEHFPVTADQAKIDDYKKRAGDSGVTVIGYGVVPFTKDEAKNRAYFEFAKAFGVSYLSADPTPDSFDDLDKLVEQYGVAVGIHNHGPGHRYAKIDTIAEAIKDHNPLIGCCIDTGHFLRSREDPVRAVEVFGKRTYGVHLKDVKDATKFTILGEGDLRVADLLQALAKLHYGYALAIEYEESVNAPMPDLKACLKAVHAAMPDSAASETGKRREDKPGR